MAAEFLSQLLNVSASDLESTVCCICHEDYYGVTDNGIVDGPVRTPCKHVMGSACLTNWIEMGNNTCPYCRFSFFSHENRPTYYESIEDGELFNRRLYFLELPEQGEIYETFDERHERYDRLRLDDWDTQQDLLHLLLRIRGNSELEQVWSQWHRHWLETAIAQPDQQSLEQAENAIDNLWAEDGWQHNSPSAQAWIVRTVRARRTLRLREYRLYCQLRPRELGAPFSELAGEPQERLTEVQEDVLFEELVRLGAFDERYLGRLGRSGREEWEALRWAGYVFDPEKEVSEEEIWGKWSCFGF